MGVKTLQIELLEGGEKFIHHLGIIEMEGIFTGKTLEEIPVKQGQTTAWIQALGKYAQLSRGIRQMLQYI
jgi:hypothetical protein